MLSAPEALERLRDGNRRFVSGDQLLDVQANHRRRLELVAGQKPFAIILGCSDSRVPVEMIFDQGLGDLFVIRVAGNIVAPSQIGSIEFAAEQFGIRLVVVLGHGQCGAVQATLDELRQPLESRSENLRAVVNRIRPAVQQVLDTNTGTDEAALVHKAVTANVRFSADQLRHGSELLEAMIEKDGLLVVGAKYSMQTGLVEFLDQTTK